MFPGRTAPRTPWIALAAALVLLVQGAFPSWAVARATGDSPFAVTMCEPGSGNAARDDKAPAGHDTRDCCDPCICAAALAVPAQAALDEPVRYALTIAPPAAIADAPSARARDPPRPPSQAPPQTV